MATIPQYNYNTAQFVWSYTHGSGPAPTGFQIKCGTAPNSYSLLYDLPATSTSGQVLVKNVIPGPGTYYATMVARNSYGEWAKAAEVPFECGAVGVGTIGFSVGG